MGPAQLVRIHMQTKDFTLSLITKSHLLQQSGKEVMKLLLFHIPSTY